jgi:lipopolysaccharide/colanic/teichoic acid biosynthesis glycosyltransferase
MIKRALDLVASATGLLVLSPVLAAVAAAIKLDSPGPVFFRQERVGMDRVPFEVVKFRTMTHRERVDQHAEQVVEGNTDARITRVGRLLRVSSVDELPQLVNVLRGEMSLIGPRPILPEQLEVVPEDKMVRFDVRPGITGLAQVNGRRSLDWMEQLAYDADYARDHHFRRDLGILLRTVTVVLTGSGIYADASKNWRAYRKPTPKTNA